MIRSRRHMLAAGSAALGLLGGPSPANATLSRPQDCSGLAAEIESLFENLPEQKAFKIWAPATDAGPELLASLRSGERLFSASTNKAFILCERLRQLDSPEIEQALVTHELTLDEAVWSLGSSVFNPPNLSGLVSEQTAMEAMITHSDNTGTDMVLKQAGVEKVRQFIASIGLKSTMIPDSTRALFGYVYGVADYKTLTWKELLAIASSGASFVHPVLNEVETFASTADELVSFFSRALEGQFFQNPQTLRQFRRILLLGDITYMVPFPLGASVFGKAGYFDYPGEHARCIAGGLYFRDRWVYFAMVLNWDAAELHDTETVEAFFRAIRGAIELVQETLGG